MSYQGVESQVAVALSNYRRIETLYENNSVALSDYEQAKNNYENAKSQLDASLAQIEASKAAAEAAKKPIWL